MAYINAGLPNNGRTQFFDVNYDEALSPGRGLDLATSMMQFCDDDLSMLAAWFSGRQLDTPLPIHLSIHTVATDSKGYPTQFVGGHWSGAGLVPLEITINIGEFRMGQGTHNHAGSYLLVMEASEMRCGHLARTESAVPGSGSAKVTKGKPSRDSWASSSC